MPAHFAVGQGGTAQHIPSAPCQRQGSVIRRTKATSQRFSTSLARSAATLSNIPAPIVKNKGTHPTHARAFCGGAGQRRFRYIQHARTIGQGRGARPRRPPARFPPRAAPRGQPHTQRHCQGGPAVRRQTPVRQARAASKSGQGNAQRPARSGTGRAPLESPGRLRKTAKDGTRRATPAGLTIPPCARYNRHSRISGGFRHVCGGRAGKPRPQV